MTYRAGSRPPVAGRQLPDHSKREKGVGSTSAAWSLRLSRFRVHRRWNCALRHSSGIFWPRLLAAALSLSATGAVMVLSRVNHPPAGATTLIVSLGIIAKPRELIIIEIAVVLLAAQALLINRLAGLPYPLWNTSPNKSAAENATE